MNKTGAGFSSSTPPGVELLREDIQYVETNKTAATAGLERVLPSQHRTKWPGSGSGWVNFVVRGYLMGDLCPARCRGCSLGTGTFRIFLVFSYLQRYVDLLNLSSIPKEHYQLFSIREEGIWCSWGEVNP